MDAREISEEVITWSKEENDDAITPLKTDVTLPNLTFNYGEVLLKINSKLGAGDQILIREDFDSWFYPYKISSTLRIDSKQNFNCQKMDVSYNQIDSNAASLRIEANNCYPEPSLFVKKPNSRPSSTSTRRKPGLKRRDSHILDDNMEINTDRFINLEEEIHYLITPEFDGHVLALHPSFMEGGYAPAKVTKATKNKSESGPSGYYDIEFYDNTKGQVEPNNLIILTEERYDQILKEIIEKERQNQGSDSSKSSNSSESSQSTVKGSTSAIDIETCLKYHQDELFDENTNVLFQENGIYSSYKIISKLKEARNDSKLLELHIEDTTNEEVRKILNKQDIGNSLILPHPKFISDRILLNPEDFVKSRNQPVIAVHPNANLLNTVNSPTKTNFNELYFPGVITEILKQNSDDIKYKIHFYDGTNGVVMNKELLCITKDVFSELFKILLDQSEESEEVEDTRFLKADVKSLADSSMSTIRGSHY